MTYTAQTYTKIQYAHDNACSCIYQILVCTKRLCSYIDIYQSPLITLFKLCLDRYKNLPGEENQMSFVNIQLDLVYFFTASLDEIKSECGGPLTACFLFIMNSTNYLATILQDWSEQPVSREKRWTPGRSARSVGLPFQVKPTLGTYPCPPPFPSP
jgi:hypothetical protein